MKLRSRSKYIWRLNTLFSFVFVMGVYEPAQKQGKVE